MRPFLCMKTAIVQISREKVFFSGNPPKKLQPDGACGAL